jgi:ATP-dependent Clp protease ATP-binding subunit ClpA
MPALKMVADAGFDPVYGARPLKRAIQQEIENPLAKEILAGNFAPGDTVKSARAAARSRSARRDARCHARHNARCYVQRDAQFMQA